MPKRNTKNVFTEDQTADSPDEQQIEAPVEESRTAALSATDTKSAVAKKLIARLREDLEYLERLLTSEADVADVENLVKKRSNEFGDVYSPSNDGKVVEGVFDGENMIGSDGHQYTVPPNYASKSKLVEGDILKLTIQGNGTFLYKQIGPIERQRVVGTLLRDEMTGDWKVQAIGRKYTVLQAAVSYHKGDEGDEAVVLIPKEAPSKWAALENVIKK